MSNQHIQKQIQAFRKEFPVSIKLGRPKSYFILKSQREQDKLEAFLKTSLEKVWEDAEKETRQTLIDNILTTLGNYKTIHGQADWNDVIKIIRSFKDDLKQTT